MSKQSRKDNQGHVLRTGESQRKNGTYSYRYAVGMGQRQTVYAATLEELRRKEEQLGQLAHLGIDMNQGSMTVSELVARYMTTKVRLRPSTKKEYASHLRAIQRSRWGDTQIIRIKTSDAKRWLIEEQNNGKKRGTLRVMHSLLRSAFRMAVEDDLLVKNPFDFAISTLLPDDAKRRRPLSPQEQSEYFAILREYGYDCCYNDMVILLETGLRVSELYGLTTNDVDIEHRRLHVRRQLYRWDGRTRMTWDPKTKTSVRTVPLSNEACAAFVRELEQRRPMKVEPIVNGVTGFIFINRHGKPKISTDLRYSLGVAAKRYNEATGLTMPTVTPHVLRHTFCTNMQSAGLDIKSLQYIMGHATANITMDMYAHATEHSACLAFDRIPSR